MTRFYLVVFLALTACAAQPPNHNLRNKVDADLFDVVSRFQESDVDTTVTVESALIGPVTDARRSAIVTECGLRVLDRLDTTAMIICPSQSLPCLARQPEFRSFRMIPAWSPDL
jgi:hypothetical protein